MALTNQPPPLKGPRRGGGAGPEPVRLRLCTRKLVVRSSSKGNARCSGLCSSATHSAVARRAASTHNGERAASCCLQTPAIKPRNVGVQGGKQQHRARKRSGACPSDNDYAESSASASPSRLRLCQLELPSADAGVCVVPCVSVCVLSHETGFPGFPGSPGALPSRLV